MDTEAGRAGEGSHWESAGKGRGEPPWPAPHPPSLPAARLPRLGGGSASGAAARVCEGWRGGHWPRAPRQRGPEGPGGTAGSRGPPHTWATRPPPGPACAATAERPRPGGAASGGRPARRPGRGVRGDELAYLCLFPDHIVGAEQVSQEQVELLLLRRGRRHCARRVREKEGGETGAVRRAGGPAGGMGAGPARGPAPAAARGWGGGAGGCRAGKGGAKGKGEDGAGTRDPSPRRGPQLRRLIGSGRGRRGRGRLLRGRADWPRTLQCRHWRLAAGRRAGRGRGGAGTQPASWGPG